MGSNARSAKTGRFVPPSTARSNPRGTVTERTGGNAGSGTHSRSAITGRYVTDATAKRHPGTTVTERG